MCRNIALLVIITTSFLVFLNVQFGFANIIPSSHFAVAGDWACRPETTTTIDNIKSKNPDLIFALGDFSYQKTANCWINEIQGLEKNNIKIIIGNHEEEPGIPQSLLIKYKKLFGVTNTFYSFNFRNMHFTIMDSNIPFEVNSSQYKFVTNDLNQASQNSSLKWKIVLFHHPIYTSPTEFYKGNDEMRKIYHPMFDHFKVDLVLQAHNHNYQRSYPLTYNNTNDETPIITSKNNTLYQSPLGEIYTVTGTAGKSLYSFLGRQYYIATQFLDHGYLDIALIDNGTKLDSNFYSNEGTVKDHFTIIK